MKIREVGREMRGEPVTLRSLVAVRGRGTGELRGNVRDMRSRFAAWRVTGAREELGDA